MISLPTAQHFEQRCFKFCWVLYLNAMSNDLVKHKFRRDLESLHWRVREMHWNLSHLDFSM